MSQIETVDVSVYLDTGSSVRLPIIRHSEGEIDLKAMEREFKHHLKHLFLTMLHSYSLDDLQFTLDDPCEEQWEDGEDKMEDLNKSIYGASDAKHPGRTTILLIDNKTLYSNEDTTHAEMLQTTLQLNEQAIREHLEQFPRASYYADENLLCIYQGLDFRMPDRVEETMLIVDQLRVLTLINNDTKIGLGLKVEEINTRWKPLRYL